MRDRSSSTAHSYRSRWGFLRSPRRAAPAEEVFDRRFEASFDLVHGVLRAHCDAETAAAHTRDILRENLDVLAALDGPLLSPEEMQRLLEAASRRLRPTT